MNLLIAEDEIRILNSLAHNIPWESHGIEVVGLAGNGREALEIAERRMPDIVLLDVEMPEMDGLTLAEVLLERAPQTGVIILSGHDDFQYAQRAIGFGAANYLLKPAGEEEILRSVLGLADTMRRRLSEKHGLAELKRKWSSRLPQLQEDFLRGLMTTRYSSWELAKHGSELNLELPGDRHYAVAVCDMDPLPEGETRFGPGDLPLLRFSLLGIAKEFMPPGEGRVFGDANGTAVAVFPGRAGETEGELTTRVNARISKLLGTVRECLKLTASAGMGTACPLPDISLSYRQACMALRERAAYGNEIAIPYLEVNRSERNVLPDSGFEKQLEIAICTGEGGQALEQVEAYARVALADADSSGLVYEHLLYLSGAFTRIMLSQGWPMKKVLGPDYAYFLSLETLVSKGQIAEWARRVTARMAAHAEEERGNSSNRLVKSLRELVDAGLEGDLSLHALAESLYVNSSYLSRLFKRETGESFSGYVLARRMERAKELLLEGAKVYDAALATGYRDISYFAKVFRKYWGIAPSELKR